MVAAARCLAKLLLSQIRGSPPLKLPPGHACNVSLRRYATPGCESGDGLCPSRRATLTSTAGCVVCVRAWCNSLFGIMVHCYLCEGFRWPDSPTPEITFWASCPGCGPKYQFFWLGRQTGMLANFWWAPGLGSVLGQIWGRGLVHSACLCCRFGRRFPYRELTA